jgi:AraC family transcriptional regulator
MNRSTGKYWRGWPAFPCPISIASFTGQVGENIAGYIRRVRMERRRAQIAYGRSDITEVALAAGYDTHAAFSKAFQTAVWYQPA